MTMMMAFQEMAGVVTADIDVGIEKNRTQTLTEVLIAFVCFLFHDRYFHEL